MRTSLKLALIVLTILVETISAQASAPAIKIVEVFVALADNNHQNIAPVSEKLGNGDDPAHNLYWGARYGFRTYFERSPDWTLVAIKRPAAGPALERCLFKHRSRQVFILASAYRGKDIKTAIWQFLQNAAGAPRDPMAASFLTQHEINLPTSLLVYMGHNGLMEFATPPLPEDNRGATHPVIILACSAKPYFSAWLRTAGAYPLLWTTGLMAPEAYTLHAALEAWIKEESPQKIELAAAKAYAQYQKCGLKAASSIFTSGW